VPWQGNYNVGNVPAIRASIARFGMNGALRVWQDGIVIAGNHALLALREMHAAAELPPTHVALSEDGDWLVPVIDVAHLPKLEAEAFAIADNRTRDLATTDDDRLAALLREIEDADADLLLATGYDHDDLARLLDQLGDLERPDVDAEPRIEEAEVLRETWKTELGQLWILGDHRLIIGDATDPAVVQRLMQNHRATLFATDPPYLVDYDGTNHPAAKDDSPARKAGKNKDWSATYKDWDRATQGDGLYDGFVNVAIQHAITEDAAWYCWHASRRQAMLEAVWERHGAFVHQQIIWVKGHGILTRSHYLWQHEPCFYGWVRGKQPRRVANDHPTTVWPVASLTNAEAPDHPTPKPLELFEIPMRQHTLPGEVCYEPFSGSGTQIIAGERLARRVFAVEIAPEYAAVAIQRWVDAVGGTPRLEEPPA